MVYSAGWVDGWMGGWVDGWMGKDQGRFAFATVEIWRASRAGMTGASVGGVATMLGLPRGRVLMYLN